MNTEKLIDKIQKLMRKTIDNGATEAEAETSLLIAQQLMAKHGIEMTEVIEKAQEISDDEKVVENTTNYKKHSWWEIMLSDIIANNFRCYTYRRIGGRQSSIVFYGQKKDAEVAKEIFSVYLTITENLAKKYVSNYPSGTRTKIKNTYIDGLLDGFSLKLRKQVENNSEMALVLVKPDALVKAYQDKSKGFRSSKPFSFSASRDAEHYHNGYSDAQGLGTQLQD